MLLTLSHLALRLLLKNEIAETCHLKSQRALPVLLWQIYCVFNNSCFWCIIWMSYC